MEYAFYQAGESQPVQEMRQKPASATRDTWFSLRDDTQKRQRPSSVATEFVDTDWDEDDIISDDEENSPRISLQSSGQPSITTMSSYDEVPTPRSSQSVHGYGLEYSPKQVEGPRGPHLFRNSTTSAYDDELVLTLSPITPKVPRGIADILAQPRVSQQPTPFQYTYEDLDTSTLPSWTPQMVAQSMLNAGIELATADRFVENDISGAILVTLKFEDLRELSIQSFGIRTRVWHQIQALRDSRPASPIPETPIEDCPSNEIGAKSRDLPSAADHSNRQSLTSQMKNREITPMESVSIIGIEQVIPKPHVCPKGENCSKWKKQQQLIQAFQKENPHVDMNTFGTILIGGDVGNPGTARALNSTQTLRPVSDAVPSVIASSDVLGPAGLPPLQYLREAALRNAQYAEAQDQVRQFLNFQQQDHGDAVPPTPPFEVTPSQAPHHGLRHLPKLSIPGGPPAPQMIPPRSSTVPPPSQHQQAAQDGFSHYRMERASPHTESPDTPKNLYRIGTPFSEMDVPVTTVPMAPVARDASQSVPPDMNFRASPVNNPSPSRCQSRASARRPSFPVMPILEENSTTPPAGRVSPSKPPSVRSQQALHAPPRVNYPWSLAERTLEKAIPPMPSLGLAAPPAPAPVDGVSHQGPMKKRKTKLLRHEWQDGYFTLKGTRLNMHKDARETDRTLEYVDIDDYAIACSSLASTSKLSAAFKAVHLSHKSEKNDKVAAFSFQLVPQDKNALKARKRESTLHADKGTPVQGVNGTGKTHHFAVKSRDDRIDWMRELMLAKAMKQKGEGFEVSVNGNMI